MTDFRKEVANIVATINRRAVVSEQDYSTTLKDLGVDSLEVANIFLNIMDNFGVEVPDSDIDRLETVEQIAAYLQERVPSA